MRGRALADAGRRVCSTTGYVAAIAIIYALYWFSVTGAIRVGADQPPEGLAATFVHSLVPIAFAYVAAHYISLLVLATARWASLGVCRR